jgi:cobalt-zinc-cadmium efflux system membrane fusion protein
MEIVDTNHIHIELSVFEKDILNVKKGQKIQFKIPEASQKTFEAEVHLVGTTIDETNRTVKVHAHILNEDETNFVVGMYVEAAIITEATASLALPKDAILETNGDYFVLVLNEKKKDGYHFKKVKINLGTQTETYASILNTNDLIDKNILVQGGYMLLNEGESDHSH